MNTWYNNLCTVLVKSVGCSIKKIALLHSSPKQPPGVPLISMASLFYRYLAWVSHRAKIVLLHPTNFYILHIISKLS